jgi:hypothetical protein
VSIFAPFRLTWSIKSPPFVGVTALLTLVATLWPGQTLASRLATPFAALIAVAAPYLFFRKYLSLLADRGHSWGYYYTVLIYYMGIIGAVISFPAIPLEWAQFRASEIPIVLILLSGPTGLAVAIAATEVANDNGWGLTNVGGVRERR